MNKLILSLFSIFLFHQSEAQQWEKAKAFNYSERYGIYKHVNDANGNIYIVGEIADESLKLDGFFMASKGDLDVFVAKLDSNFSVIWANQFGSSGEETVTGIAIDKNNDVLISGYFTQSIVIGKDTIKSIGSSDFFFTKMDNDGNVKWTKSGGSTSQDNSDGRTGGIYTDNDNNIYVAGMFANIVDDTLRTAWFDGLIVKSYGEQDIFVAKYTSAGKITWLKNFGGYARDIGEISLVGEFLYLCGGSRGEINYDSSVFKNPYGGSYVAFVLKIDFNGNVVWANGCYLKKFGSLYARSVTSDSNENVYFTGLYYPVSFDNRLVFGAFEIAEIGGIDIFIAKFDRNGNAKWLKKVGGYSNDGPGKIICKNNNHFILTGNLSGGGIYETKKIESPSGQNTFILEIDSNGIPLVFEQCGNTGKNSGSDLSITTNGKLLISGDNAGGILNFDSIYLPNLDKPAGFFIARRNFVSKLISVNPQLNDFGFKIFPNPSSGIFSVEIENPDEETSIMVFDLIGNQIKKIETSKFKKNYLIEMNIAKGIYIVSIKNGDKVYHQKVSVDQ